MTDCLKCKITHTYEGEDGLYCTPPMDKLVFGEYTFDPIYRGALYMRFPFYTTKEIISSYLGHNPHFLSQEEWLKPESEEEEEEPESEEEEE